MQNRYRNQNTRSQKQTSPDSARGNSFIEGFNEGFSGRQGQQYRGRMENDYANDQGYRNYKDMAESGLRNDYNYDRSDDGGYLYPYEPQRAYHGQQFRNEQFRNESRDNRQASDSYRHDSDWSRGGDWRENDSSSSRTPMDLSGRYSQDYMSRYEAPERQNDSYLTRHGADSYQSSQSWQYPQERNFSATRYGSASQGGERSYNNYAGSGERTHNMATGHSSPSSEYYGTRHDLNAGSRFGQTSQYGQTGQFSGKGPKGYRRSDERIREDVCEALEHHPSVDASEIDVTVKEGIATLTGTIQSRQMKRQAEECVEGVRGINDVKNELRVDTMNASQGTTSETSATEAGSRGTLNGNRTSQQTGRSSSSTSSSASATKQ